MIEKIPKFLMVFFMTLLLTSLGLAQRQAGSIKGSINEEEGSPLPGVSITVTSPALQGQETYVSTAEGDFRFPVLPVGTYTIKAELPGFKTVERTGVIVSLGKVVTIRIEMQVAGMEEEVTVTAPSPTVDVESSGISITVPKEIIESIPMRRNILDVYRAAPGTTGQNETYDYQKWSSVAGGALHESKMSVDGVDLVDPMRGYISGDIAFDAIEEVEISLGGHKAEVGQTSAGYVNVISRSGGNDFSGRVTFLMNTDKLTQNIIPQEDLDSLGLSHPVFFKYKRDIGVFIGGPIIKDRLWFFISPRYNDKKKNTFFIPFTDPDGVSHPAYDYTRYEYVQLNKFTASFSKNIRWMGMYQYNKFHDQPDAWAIDDKYRPLESQQQHFVDDTHVATSSLTFVLNQNTYADVKVGYVKRHMYLYNDQYTGASDRPRVYDRYSGKYWGATVPGEVYYKNSLTLSGNATRFQDNLLGVDHEFKTGFEYFYGSSTNEGPSPNAQYYLYWWNETPWYYHDSVPYKGRFSIRSGDVNEGDMPREYGTWRLSGYLQDSIKIGTKLSLNIGLRYDETHGFKKAETYKGWTDPNNGLANILLPEIFVPYDMDAPAIDDVIVYKRLSPRFGLTFDPFGKAKTALKLSWSRYSEIMVSENMGNLDSYGSKTISFTWYDDNMNGIFDLPPVDRYFTGSYTPYITDVESMRNRFASDLNSPLIDELIFGISQEIAKNFSMSIDFIYKNTSNLIATVNTVNPRDSNVWVPYEITDPGPDGNFGTGNEQTLTVYLKDRNALPDNYRKENVSDAFRRYWGIDLILFKRMSNNWQFMGNITYSKAYGNYPHGYHSVAGNTDWSDPNNFLFREGRLEFDRPLGIKLMGTIILPLDINFSAYYRYLSGTPWNRTLTVYFPSEVNGVSPKSDEIEILAEPSGSHRTTPEFNSLDIRIEKEFKVGPGMLGVWIEAFNLFGYYTYNINRDNGGYIYPDGSYVPYPRYGDIISAQGTRTVNLALRYTF